MFATTRRRPSLDLRKAAKLAELATKQEIEAFSLENDMGSLYRSKLLGNQLRLSTSTPMLLSATSIYTSDEEQPSPKDEEEEEEEDESSMSEYASCEELADDSDFDGDDEEFEYEDDLKIFEPALATIVSMQVFKPSLVDLSVLAPMAARSVPISRPQSASYTTFVRVKAPAPTVIRSSIYMAPAAISSTVTEKAVPNFSTPMARNSSLSPPGSLHSGSSPASSVLSLSRSDEIEDDHEAIIRESDEIQMRQAVLAGTAWDDEAVLESPTPTSWAHYDPFALSIPTLSKAQTFNEDVREKTRGWRRLGLKSAKFLAGNRRGGVWS